MRVQKMHGLYGLKQQIVEISGDVTGVEQTTITTTTREDSASQLVTQAFWSVKRWVSQYILLSFLSRPRKLTKWGVIIFRNLSLCLDKRASWHLPRHCPRHCSSSWSASELDGNSYYQTELTANVNVYRFVCGSSWTLKWHLSRLLTRRGVMWGNLGHGI